MASGHPITLLRPFEIGQKTTKAAWQSHGGLPHHIHALAVVSVALQVHTLINGFELQNGIHGTHAFLSLLPRGRGHTQNQRRRKVPGNADLKAASISSPMEEPVPSAAPGAAGDAVLGPAFERASMASARDGDAHNSAKATAGKGRGGGTHKRKDLSKAKAKRTGTGRDEHTERQNARDKGKGRPQSKGKSTDNTATGDQTAPFGARGALQTNPGFDPEDSPPSPVFKRTRSQGSPPALLAPENPKKRAKL